MVFSFSFFFLGGRGDKIWVYLGMLLSFNAFLAADAVSASENWINAYKMPKSTNNIARQMKCQKDPLAVDITPGNLQPSQK